MATVRTGTSILDPFIARIKRENESEAKRTEKLHAEAFEEAHRLAHQMGAADPALSKVILFGSALPGRVFRSDSDIDLAVVGGNMACLQRIAERSTFHVDIVSLDDMRAGIREGILREGLVMYVATES